MLNGGVVSELAVSSEFVNFDFSVLTVIESVVRLLHICIVIAVFAVNGARAHT